MTEMKTTTPKTEAAAHNAAVIAADIKPVAKSTDRQLTKIKKGVDRAEVLIANMSAYNKEAAKLTAAAEAIPEAEVIRPHKVKEVKNAAAAIVSAYHAAKKAAKSLNDLTADYAAKKGEERTTVARDISKRLEGINAAAAIVEENLTAAKEALDLIAAPKTSAEKREELTEEVLKAVKGKKASEVLAKYGEVHFGIFPTKSMLEAALGEAEGRGAYYKITAAAEALLVACLDYRVKYEAAAEAKSEAAAEAMSAAKDKAFNELKSLCELFSLKNGENIGYNSSTIGTISAKSYRFIAKEDIKEGYNAAAKSSLAFMREVLKELTAADSITAAAEAAAKKAADRAAKKAAREAKKNVKNS